MSVWAELKRRKVVRVAGAYAIVSWVLLQLTSVLTGLLALPEWIGRTAVLLVVIGFPVSMVLAWAFDITRKGIVRDRRTQQNRFGISSERILLGVVLILTGWLLYRLEFDTSEPDRSTDTMAEISLSAGVPESEQSSSMRSQVSVAILPFENLSPDPDNAYFAAGLHEEVLHQLARIRDLKVISRKSVLQYADKDIGIPAIADELRVSSVMEGSARFSGNNVRIKAQLVDGKTDEHLWVEVYQRELTDIFSIQADIAERIAKQLEINFLPADRQTIESRRTESPEALASYLQAVTLDWGSPRDKDKALALLDKTIAADPAFPSAVALRALVHATSLNNTPGTVEDWRARNQRVESMARADAELALQLDPGQGRAYVALARISQYRWKGREAHEAYQAGLRVSPNDIDLLRGFAWFNSVAANHGYAIELAERAVILDPMNAAAHAELGQRHTFAGNWDAAFSAHSAAALLDPDYGVYRLRVANNEIARGNIASALEELRAASELIDESQADPELLAQLAYAYARAGSKDNALRVVEIISSMARNTYVSVGARAMSAIAAGEYSEALTLLEEFAVDVKSNEVIDGGFKSLAQIAANALADPALEQPNFREVRGKLTFRD